jgi:hypothetical protein
MWRRLGTIQLLSLLLLFSAGCPKAHNQTKAPALSPDERALAGIECKVFCSKVKLRTPVAELTWMSSEVSLTGQGLEVTVYKDGFEKGQYARLSLIERNQKFVLQQAERYAGGTRPPGLDQLIVVDVRTQRTALRQKAANRVTVQIEGLEPGLNYYWRVTPSTAAGPATKEGVGCQAPICPADMQPGVERP